MDCQVTSTGTAPSSPDVLWGEIARALNSPRIWTGGKRAAPGKVENGDNSVIDFPAILRRPSNERMGVLLPDLVDAVEKGFLLLFAFLCLLAFIIPFYCYHPYTRQRNRDIEDQDEYVQRATQLPYSDDNANPPQ